MSSGPATPQGTPPGATSAARPRASKVRETSANPAGPRVSEPAKITSSIERPRRCLADCSPMTQRIASTTLDLPHPFGPTIDVTGSGNAIDVLSTNDLKPQISMRLIFNRASATGGGSGRDHTSRVSSRQRHLVTPGPRTCKQASRTRPLGANSRMLSAETAAWHLGTPTFNDTLLPAMDSSLPFTAADLYQLAAVLGGVGVTGALGLLFVRRARAARRRQIESVGEAPEPIARHKRPESLPATDEPEEAPRRSPSLSSARASGAAPARASQTRPTAPVAPPDLPEPAGADIEPEPEPRAAQVIPFPVPVPARPALARTRSSGFIARLGEILTGRKELDPSFVDQIEKVLLSADIGVPTSQKLLEEIRGSLTRRELKDPDAVWAFLRRRSAELLAIPAPEIDFSSARPFVLLVIGVNGSGKTTTIAKLGAGGKRVLLAAGDTFRAAAAEQLEIWAGRSNATLVRGKEGADPSSVIFDGVKRAVAEGFDVAIADTAGRLHTKTDL